MVDAEEKGITQQNIAHLKQTKSPIYQAFFNDDAQNFGLDTQWRERIIEQIGNYGESFRRALGQHSALQLPRGKNALWTQGGLMYAPPLRDSHFITTSPP